MKEFTRTYSVIHLDSIYKNIEEAKKRVGSDTKIMAIVKANAYGHGAVEVAGAIKDKVYGFAVATVREALTLRESGVDNPILVLGYVCKAEYESVIRNNIIFAMLTKDMAKDISECAVRIGITAKCHIKINTGMNRIGFPVNEEAIDDIAELTGYEGLDCEGIFMHFGNCKYNIYPRFVSVDRLNNSPCQGTQYVTSGNDVGNIHNYVHCVIKS